MLSDAGKNIHPAPHGLTLYYWPCSLILLARTLVLDRSTSPLCATLRIACGEPYEIEVNGQTLRTRASLVAPGARRNRVTAIDSRVALFYIPIDTTRLAQVKQMLGTQELINLPIEQFAHLLPAIESASRGELSPADARSLMDHTVAALIGEPLEPRQPMDPRVRKVIQVLGTVPLNEIDSDALCAQVHLSASRLRALFKAETGCTIQQYARWLAVWRACFLWRRGLSFTAIAAEAGFHDLSHVDHAFTEVFGISPTQVIDTRSVDLINCEESSADAGAPALI